MCIKLHIITFLYVLFFLWHLDFEAQRFHQYIAIYTSLQVGAEIPEHDTITRRKQFRAKKDRAERLRQKKEEKKAQKANKADQKTDKKAGKKTKKAGKGSEEQNQGQEQKKRLQGELPGKDDVVEPVPKKKGRLDQVHGVEPRHHKKARGKGLKRLRRAKASNIGEVPKKRTSRKNRSNKATRDDKDEKVENESKSKEDNKRKVKDKQEKGLSSKVAKHSVEAPVDDKVKEMVKDVLQECRKTHCCHPSFEVPNFDKKVFQVSVYWNRTHVGVKLHKSKISDHKGSKGAFVQVAYFGCQTNCTYSNLALAHLYASCFQHASYIVFFVCGPLDPQAAPKIWDQCSILRINVLPLGQNIQECGDI